MMIVLLMLASVLAGCIGTDGEEGVSGSQGELGEQGLQGETGDQGPQGIQGETGPAGANLTGADLTGVHWYDTTCPDGTNSDNNGNTCVSNL